MPAVFGMRQNQIDAAKLSLAAKFSGSSSGQSLTGLAQNRSSVARFAYPHRPTAFASSMYPI